MENYEVTAYSFETLVRLETIHKINISVLRKKKYDLEMKDYWDFGDHKLWRNYDLELKTEQSKLKVIQDRIHYLDRINELNKKKEI